MSVVRKILITLPATLAAAAAVCLALTFAAGAASASTAGTHSSFAAQARAYGLSSAQASTLQQEVNTYIAQHGGKQIAINEVAFNGGTTMFAVPGQKYAHPETASRSGINVEETCPVGAFCTFSGANFTGSESAYYSCNTWFSNNWNGSWKNDQTHGIKATLKIYNTFVHKSGTYVTCAAYCNDAHWTAGVDITAVDPC